MAKKIVNDLSWMIGGPQGTGVDSSANLFARSCVAGGLWIFGKREYHSNIMGEHSYFQIRVSDKPVGSHLDPVHLLATFEDSTARIHAHELVPGGALIYDPTVTHPENLNLPKDVLLVPLDYAEVLRQVAADTGESFSKLVIMKNTISVAASCALLEFDEAIIERALGGIFTGRKAKLVPMNMTVAKKAYSFIKKEYIDKFPYKLQEVHNVPKRLVLTGTNSVALGKLKAGCRFQTYYPITPASDESVYLEGLPEYGMLVMQCEDEIASVEQTIAAAIMGVRASTSTSGPGFSLMAEGIGWAGMNEVPIVVVNYQRGGPATGLPTRHEQGELFFSIHFAHGEFPRLVIAPADHEEYFYDAFEAFNYADRYQTPVVLLTDKNIGNNTQSVLPFDESKLKIDRGKIATKEDLNRNSIDGMYKRFLHTESGVSPRTIPGTKGGIFWMTGDEHDELGHIDESAANRVPMHEKRMRKLELMAREIPEKEQVRFFGDPKAEITILSWGSPKGAILDALPKLKKEGISVNFLQVHLIWPFPVKAVTRILEKTKTIIDIEMNYTGQMASLLRRETGIEVDHKVLKWNGRPISETEVFNAVREIAEKSSEKVVLTAGM
jgi:2-oxoglutarate ferredoxin oxidoreductase subunit alpha